MRIDATLHDRTYHYRMTLDDDDRRESQRDFQHGVRSPLRLVGDRWQVELPLVPRALHPDLHAAAILTAVQIFVGSRLTLPFAVSPAFAEHVRQAFGVTLAPVDDGVAPRRPPASPRICLLFSGGMDSMAASLVFPARTLHLFLDRIAKMDIATPAVAVDLRFQRELCDALRSDGREVLATRDDHEALYRPYPVWSTDPSRLPALYLADHFGLHAIEMGDVLGSVFLTGYRAGVDADAWRFHPASVAGLPERERINVSLLEAVGLARRASLCGLSEVATTRIVRESPYWGRTTSCYQDGEQPFCMRCDKCFKKIVLGHVVAGEEVPRALVEHFLGYRYLAEIFTGRYFDWHHVWYYIFQHARCSHPLFVELGRQARQGPDLSCLAKWYPGTRPHMTPEWRDELEERVTALVGVMTPDEARRLESLDMPPLDPPALGSFWTGSDLADAPAAASPGGGGGPSTPLAGPWAALAAALSSCGGGSPVALSQRADDAGEVVALRARLDVADGHVDLEACPAGEAGAVVAVLGGRVPPAGDEALAALHERLREWLGDAAVAGGAGCDGDLVWFAGAVLVRSGDDSLDVVADVRGVGAEPEPGFPCGPAWRLVPRRPAGADDGAALLERAADATAGRLAAAAPATTFLADLWGAYGRALLPRRGARASVVAGRTSAAGAELTARAAGGATLTLVFAPALRDTDAAFATNGRITLSYRQEKGAEDPVLLSLLDLYASVL